MKALDERFLVMLFVYQKIRFRIFLEIFVLTPLAD